MDGRPVVIRLLDPPLHEFLPSHYELSATTMESDDDAVAMLVAVEEMREVNPMLGLRGCRVGLMFPRIYEIQTHSILEAARRVSADGVVVRPEIIVPLVSHCSEMRLVPGNIEAVIKRFLRETGSDLSPKIGTMVETAQGGPDRRLHRRERRLIQLWDQRLDPDHLWLQPG